MLGPELANCWLKIGRADEHTKTVTEEISAWLNSKPYSLTSHRNPEGREHRLIFHLDSGASPCDRWSLICGDAIHNLRSALDHLIYAVAVREFKSDPPPNERNLQFPI